MPRLYWISWFLDYMPSWFFVCWFFVFFLLFSLILLDHILKYLPKKRCMKEKIWDLICLKSSSHLVDQMAEYRIFILKYFPFRIFKSLLHCLTFQYHCWEVPYHFSLEAFKIFVLSIWKSQWCALMWVYFHLLCLAAFDSGSSFPSVLGNSSLPSFLPSYFPSFLFLGLVL